MFAAERIQGRKLYEEIRYLEFFANYNMIHRFFNNHIKEKLGQSV